MKRSAVISSSSMTHGIGAYARRLFSLGLFDDLYLFKVSTSVSEKGYEKVVRSPFSSKFLYQAHVFSSFYLPSRWGKAVSEMERVHFASPDWFQLAKYNGDCYGTVHDLIPLQFPQYHSPYFRLYFRKGLSRASLLKGVVAVSKATADSLLDVFPDLRVTVIHQWTDDDFRPRDKEEARRKLGLPLDKKVVLSVGRDSPTKNLGIIPPVVNALGYFLLRIGGSSSIRERVHEAVFLERVPQELMPYYYNAADALVAPSLAEGFDYPVAEAINSGISVVASDIPVHREIMKGGGHLVDPQDAEGWADAVEKAAQKRDDWSFLEGYYRGERAKREYERFYGSFRWGPLLGRG